MTAAPIRERKEMAAGRGSRMIMGMTVVMVMRLVCQGVLRTRSGGTIARGQEPCKLAG